MHKVKIFSFRASKIQSNTTLHPFLYYISLKKWGIQVKSVRFYIIWRWCNFLDTYSIVWFSTQICTWSEPCSWVDGYGKYPYDHTFFISPNIT